MKRLTPIFLAVALILTAAACVQKQDYAPADLPESHSDWYDGSNRPVPDHLELKANPDVRYFDEPFRVEAYIVFMDGSTQNASIETAFGVDGYIEQTDCNLFTIYGPGTCTITAEVTYLNHVLEDRTEVSADGGFKEAAYSCSEPILSVVNDGLPDNTPAISVPLNP